MYEIKLNKISLELPLNTNERLGLMQKLQDLGLGTLEVTKLNITQEHGDLIANTEIGMQMPIRIRRESIVPIVVESGWNSEEPEEGVRCLPASRYEVQEILDWLGEDEEPEEIKINGVVHQCIKYPLDSILDAAEATGYKGDLTRIYICREGEIHQHVSERHYRLEELGAF